MRLAALVLVASCSAQVRITITHLGAAGTAAVAYTLPPRLGLFEISACNAYVEPITISAGKIREGAAWRKVQIIPEHQVDTIVQAARARSRSVRFARWSTIALGVAGAALGGCSADDGCRQRIPMSVRVGAPVGALVSTLLADRLRSAAAPATQSGRWLSGTERLTIAAGDCSDGHLVLASVPSFARYQPEQFDVWLHGAAIAGPATERRPPSPSFEVRP